MKRLLASYFIFFILLFSLVTPQAAAQVLINEVSPVTSSEWVEIYNSGSETVSLKGYVVNFGSESQNKEFCDGTTISANTHISITLTTSWLSNTGDTITLKKDSATIDSVSYGNDTLGVPTNTQSLIRAPAGGLWSISDTPTPAVDSVSFECPTPTTVPATPILTSTPKPTATQTPTPTVKPTNTIAPSPTSSRNVTYPTSKANVGKLSTTTLGPTAVLGAKTAKEPEELVVSKASSPTPSKEKKLDSQTLTQKIFLGVMGGLTIITIGLGAYLYKKGKDQL